MTKAMPFSSSCHCCQMTCRTHHVTMQRFATKQPQDHQLANHAKEQVMVHSETCFQNLLNESMTTMNSSQLPTMVTRGATVRVDTFLFHLLPE